MTPHKAQTKLDTYPSALLSHLARNHAYDLIASLHFSASTRQSH